MLEKNSNFSDAHSKAGQCAGTIFRKYHSINTQYSMNFNELIGNKTFF